MNLSEKDVLDDLDEDDDDLDDDAPQGDFAYGLNPRHYVRMARRGPKLLVVFEAAPPSASDLSGHTPTLEALAGEMGWSSLTMISQGHTWFRDPEVIAFFDALVDGTLLDSFDDVLLYGAGSAGHAALSFAICAPASRVLALAPQASYNPEVLAWDNRHPEADRVDFGERYPPSREYLEALDEIYAAYDPEVVEDQRHMALLDAATVLPLVCRRLGTNLEQIFQEFGILDDVVSDAMEGLLDEVSFYQTLRARRENAAYLRSLVSKLIAADRPYLEALVVRNVAERLGRNRYARRLHQLEAKLAQDGITLPPSRNAKR